MCICTGYKWIRRELELGFAILSRVPKHQDDWKTYEKSEVLWIFHAMHRYSVISPGAKMGTSAWRRQGSKRP